jgi:hypothetical protein
MEEDDFYNMYFMNYGYTHFTLRQSYPTPVQYVREILKILISIPPRRYFPVPGRDLQRSRSGDADTLQFRG